MHPSDLSEQSKQQIREEASIYKRAELTEYESAVNVAAGELCISDISLLKRRGELLSQARKKVADDGYVFKKGFSRSKVYGKADVNVVPSVKRPKYDEEMRADRIKCIDDELSDITRLMKFKEKRVSQAESSKSYKTCEQVTEEIMTLKNKATELNREKRLFEKKANRAKRRIIRKKRDSTPSPEPRSDASRRSSKSSSSSSCGSSSRFLQSQLTAPKINEAIIPNKKDKQGSENDPIACDSETSDNSKFSSPTSDTESHFH